MRLAAIDVGTNSVRLLIAEVAPGRFHPLLQSQAITRLGEGVAGSGLLQPAAISRTLEAIDSFLREVRTWGASEVYLAATQAVREAANREDLLAPLRERGMEVRVLSGEEEANLGFLGATTGFPHTDGLILVCDVGGGSTEFAWGRENVEGTVSLPLGAVTLSETFLRSDPPSSQEIQSARDRLADALNALPSLHPDVVIGTGGTLTALTALSKGIVPYDPAKVHGSVLTREELERLTERLAAMTLKERRTLRGLQPERAETIVAGALICAEVLAHLPLPQITVSETDLLWGILLRYHRISPEISMEIPGEPTYNG